MPLRHGRAPWVAAVVVLCVATLGFFTQIQLYRPTGPDLLVNSRFAEGLAGWRAEGPGTAITTVPGLAELKNDVSGRQIGLKQTIRVPDGDSSLKLRAEVAAAGISPGPEAWHSARVYAVPIDAEGEPLWGRLTVLSHLREDSDWYLDESVVVLPRNAAAVRVGIQMAWTTGQMQVRHLSLTPVVQRAFVAPGKAALAGAWLILAVALGWRLWRETASVRKRAVVVLPLVLMVGGILMPERLKSLVMAGLLGAPDAAATDAAVAVQAASHFTLFALVAVVLRLLRPDDRAIVQAAGLALLAMSTEVLQFFSAGRTPRTQDWLIDMSGVVTGLTIAGAVLALRSRRGRRNAPAR